MSRFQRFRGNGRLVISTAVFLLAGMIGRCVHGSVAGGAPGDGRLAAGSEQFKRGATGDAIESWREARRLYKAAGQKHGEIDALADLATAYQYTGDYAAASSAISDALSLTDSKTDPSEVALLKSQLGTIATWTRDFGKAEFNLNEAANLAEQAHDDRALAGILNNRGIFYSARSGAREATAQTPVDEPEVYQKLAKEDGDSAVDDFRRSAALAEKTPNHALAAKAKANEALVEADLENLDEADRANSDAQRIALALPDSREKAYLLVTIGKTDTQVLAASEKAGAARQSLAVRARQSLEQAAEVATQLDDALVRSYALGYLGHLLEEQKQGDEALSATRQASFWAQRAQSPLSLYRWQWQAARLLRDAGKTDDAIDAYAIATQTLAPVQSDIALGNGNGSTRLSFRQEVGPIYFELADLLLQRARDGRRTEQQQQADLVKARDTVESLKSGELENYFQDRCVNQIQRRQIAALDPGTAVIYVISLESRIELLIDFPPAGQIASNPAADSKLVEIPVRNVSHAQLEKVVTQFREMLERRASNGYLEGAKKLYAWLVEPMAAELRDRKIKTLVFVPDGALRTVPMAALYDATTRRFLIQQYAVAVTPGLTLMAPEPLKRGNIRLLLNGLSVSREGLPALPNVRRELDGIQALFPDRNKELIDEQFKVGNVQMEIGQSPYTIVHIASHGEFKGTARNTFVLAYDRPIRLDDLQRLIQPRAYKEGAAVELLTLSACQTAAGDDRAALGLAGVAIKAGARSALASLWFVNDASSSDLMSQFYRELSQKSGISKAQALQNAQIQLLENPDTAHPDYWAPFIVIGNWL